MSHLTLIGKGKMSQKAALILLEQIEKLREAKFEDLKQGVYMEEDKVFRTEWRIMENTPYWGTKQIQVRVLYTPGSTVVIESIFYRSEA